MKKILTILTITFVFYNTHAQDKINWISFEKAIALNKKNPKPILVGIYAEWCGFCKKMDLQTYADKTIIKAINDNYYAVKLNGEEKKDIVYKNHTFKYQKKGKKGFHELPVALMNGKLSYPTTVFFSKEGTKIQSVSGYLKKQKFEKVLAYFAEDAYKNTKWKVFEKMYKGKL
ncbi:thioredoxin family protein [Polaribacter tangerinus]|uniref:thioredoxin family protein n=1 Tax=Polaribacter tangerinus TaxID=1920034 RepID=UPI000B4AC32B|nr:DUF255 domain-containing protein [Polaribacter tangerinus]